MRAWRRYPPVFSPIHPSAFRRAVTELRRRDAGVLEEAAAHLSALYPAHRAVLVDSGTSALTLALRLAEQHAPARGRADPPVVALPAYACPDLATACIGAGCRMALYDTDPETLEPDLESLEACLRCGATVVVVAHLFGRLVDVPTVRRLAEPFGAIVVEDAAQHAGGTLHGRRGGGLAELGVLSFGRGKGLHAGGGGALLLSRDTCWDEGLLMVDRPSGQLGALFGAVGVEVLSRHPVLYGLAARLPWLRLGETMYRPPGTIRWMLPVQGRLLIGALHAEPTELASRRESERALSEALAACGNVRLPRLGAGVLSGALRLPVICSPTRLRGLASFGVVRSYPRTLAEYPEVTSHVVRAPGLRPAWPGAKELAAGLHTLPTYSLRHDPLQHLLLDCVCRD